MTIILSHLAQKDLDEIKEYTIELWGRDQWFKYYRGLIGAFEAIIENPEKGRARDLFYPEMRSVNYEKHVVFYRRIKSNNDGTVILRIVHQKRNLPALIYYEELD